MLRPNPAQKRKEQLRLQAREGTLPGRLTLRRFVCMSREEVEAEEALTGADLNADGTVDTSFLAGWDSANQFIGVSAASIVNTSSLNACASAFLSNTVRDTVSATSVAAAP